MTRIASSKILGYKGTLTFDIIEDILDDFKSIMTDLDVELVVQKRLYSIMVECLENTYRHNFDANSSCKHDQVELELINNENDFQLNIGNYVSNERVDDLTEKIDLINALDLKGLNRLYRASISKARISDKGGAGLGFIEIARNSRQHIKYNFSQEHNNYSFFELEVKISKNPNKFR